MIKFIARIVGMSQKFSVDNDGKPRVDLSLKLEIKDGKKRVPEISKHLNKPVNIDIQELQPGLIKSEEE